MRLLPKPELSGHVSVEEAIAKRRSVREYHGGALEQSEISQLLWAAQGMTDAERGLRATPSAGSTYPLDMYLVTCDGVFRYISQKHQLEEVSQGDMRQRLSQVALGQASIAKAPVSIVLSGTPQRVTDRYGRRGEMYMYMEAGHAAQNVHLQAVALGLASVPVGAFNDSEVALLLRLNPGERPLYIIPVAR